MYCPNCKQEFDGKFCPECGTKLIEKTQRICPNCNIEVESKFCPECGAKIVEMAVKATATGEIVAASQQEDAETCYQTAQDYQYGKNGKQQDDEAAAQWYLKAAEQGHLESYYCLGNMLKEVCEFKDAFGCFQEAAEQGHAASQYELGVAYSLGFGTEQNDEESMKWYRKAAEQGHEEAIDFLEELRERVPAGGEDEEKKNNKSTKTKNLKQKEEPRISIKSLIETITVTNTSNGENTWEFGEYDDLEPLYTHLSSYCNCPEELQEKEMTITEIRDYLEKRRGHDFLVTIIKYANFLQLGEEDWNEFESWFVNDYSLYGKYAVQCRVGNEVIEKMLNLSSTIRNMKFIHCISNFRVKDEDGNELVDTREQAWEALDRLTSVLERVGADTLPLDEYLDNDDAEGVLENEDCDDILKEIVKFACALSDGEELQVGDDGLFETPDNFNEATCYEIYFPDANRYTCYWPLDSEDFED